MHSHYEEEKQRALAHQSEIEEELSEELNELKTNILETGKYLAISGGSALVVYLVVRSLVGGKPGKGKTRKKNRPVVRATKAGFRLLAINGLEVLRESVTDYLFEQKNNKNASNE